MISPYLLRLLCLSFASFFLAYLLLSLAVIVAAPAAIRLTERMRPLAATRILLALRLAPLATAAFAVLGLCLPSYFLLEPRGASEQVGLACIAAALAGAAAWTVSIGRTLGAVFGSCGHLRSCGRFGEPAKELGEAVQVQVIESEAPLMALAGVVRPRILVSRGILHVLSPEQLDVAMRHERAHWASRDNLKRLLLLLAPDPFLFFCGLGRLDRLWAKFAEWDADDRAVAGDCGRSLSLAAALVSVARMGKPVRQAPWLATLVSGEAVELSARVDRLLGPGPACENPRSRLRLVAGGAAIVATTLLVALVFQPATLDSVHRLLEHLVR